MADAAGDIIRTVPFVVIKGVTKTNTAIEKGQLLAFDTDGWAPANNSHTGPFGVALNDQSAEAGVQKEAHVMLHGQVRIQKVTGAISQGQGIMPSATDGKVTVWTIADVGSAPDQTSINAAILDSVQKAGTCVEDAASGDDFVEAII